MEVNLRALSINFVRTDRPAHSHLNENFIFNKN